MLCRHVTANPPGQQDSQQTNPGRTQGHRMVLIWYVSFSSLLLSTAWLMWVGIALTEGGWTHLNRDDVSLAPCSSDLSIMFIILVRPQSCLYSLFPPCTSFFHTPGKYTGCWLFCEGIVHSSSRMPSNNSGAASRRPHTNLTSALSG